MVAIEQCINRCNSANLQGEEQPPNKQKLNGNQQREKEATMLNNATKTLAKYWDHLRYDGNAVVPVPIGSNSVSHYKDHACVEKFMNAPLRELDSDTSLVEIRKEFKFLAKHADQHLNEISFMSCQLFKEPGEECEYCTSNPSPDCPAFNDEKNKAGFMLDPVLSDTHEGHYKTYLELKTVSSSDMQRQIETEFGTCSSCPNWVFSSVTERSRHKRLLHPKMTLETLILSSKPTPLQTHICKYKIKGKQCGATFKSYHMLYKHKKQNKHMRNRERAAKESAVVEGALNKQITEQKRSIKGFFSNKRMIARKSE